MSLTPETIFSILIGIGLAASVGFRIFVPLFALSLASYFNVIPLNDNWEWVGSSMAIIILGVATLVEILAYFIPWLDNILDTIAVPLAAVAGTAVMVSTVSDLDPTITWALAIIAGGGTAAVIKGSTSTTRLASTATTAGIANPVISTVETGTSIVMSVLAIFIPILAIIFVVLILWLIIRVFKLFKRKKATV
ncbi:protein of unknown function [Lutibacter oricola]|uniref:DUF4126 domain-containing protein n=1 Tax=Lutibacter oricola TaxID=762486 RepID=A0A1H2WCA3_9FLAO|nr:DUF4126 domain-containing protein [Lutibacter oricola]SDW78116.1 protein of unknown function [Lutibacter oricola]